MCMYNVYTMYLKLSPVRIVRSQHRNCYAKEKKMNLFFFWYYFHNDNIQTVN